MGKQLFSWMMDWRRQRRTRVGANKRQRPELSKGVYLEAHTDSYPMPYTVYKAHRIGRGTSVYSPCLSVSSYMDTSLFLCLPTQKLISVILLYSPEYSQAFPTTLSIVWLREEPATLGLPNKQFVTTPPGSFGQHRPPPFTAHPS